MMRILLSPIGAILFHFLMGSCIAQTEPDTTSLCVLQETVPAGAHHEVVVSGVYFQGIEHTTLTDSPCAGRRTWIEFDLQKGDNEKTLQDSLGDIRWAFVVFQGEFYGPPLHHSSIPDVLAKNLQPPRWGHLGCCKTQLVVHHIHDVQPLVKKSDYPDCSVVVKEAVIPRYPSKALAAGVQGAVYIRAQLNRAGCVEKADAIAGDPLLVPEAMEAAKMWLFGSSNSEKLVELEFQFEAVPSNDLESWIGSFYSPPFTVFVIDRVPVKQKSP